MKGIFKSLKGKRGGALVAVMAAMAVLSIVALCAASIALTNYRTTQTYVSQDSYYYSAETGQSQFVSHLNDVAYSHSSGVENWTEAEVNNLYEAVANADLDLSDTVYNGSYTVDNEVKSYKVDDAKNATFTILTTVTNKEDGSSQQYTSTIKINNPMGGSSETTEIIKVPLTPEGAQPLFNNGYSLVTNGSGKNTYWYGLWGNFNTYTTQTKNKYPLSGSGSNISVNNNNLSKCLTLESKKSGSGTGTSDNFGTAVYLKFCLSSNETGGSGSFRTLFNVDSTNATERFNSFFNNISVDITGAINSMKNDGSVTKIDSDKTTLLLTYRGDKYTQYGSTMVMDAEEKYYYTSDGKDNVLFTLDFATRPVDTGKVYLETVYDSKGDSLFESDAFQPVYRTVFTEKTTTDRWGNTSTTTTHYFAYRYQTNGTKTEIVEVDTNSNSRFNKYQTYYTYADHYYKNKWFFIDLNGTGTFLIDNASVTTVERDSTTDRINHHWESSTTNYYMEDAWGNINYAQLGNIVMEDCYFFVNGNIEVGNAFNMSNCKFFATKNIYIDPAYYTEGLLSLETEAGSDVIEQSLYYCDGYFESNLISRYAMNWILKYPAGWMPDYYQLPQWDKIGDGWMNSKVKECALKTGYSYPASGSEGWLATYRYPTVLKATIIATGRNGTKSVDTTGYKANNTAQSSITCDNVTVYLNPHHSTYSVVDCIFIEGQIFSGGNIFTANYNYSPKITYPIRADATNRYASASQIQYQPFTNGQDIVDIEKAPTIEDIFSEINSSIVTTETNPVIIVNGGITKK